MAIILEMDKQRRIRIPKKVKLESDTFLLIIIGPYKMLFPIPKEKPEVDISEKDVTRLLKDADRFAKEDALSRLHRRLKEYEKMLIESDIPAAYFKKKNWLENTAEDYN